MDRPNPPDQLRYSEALGVFEPAPQVVEWIEATFLNEQSPLFDESHRHLKQARLAALWTNVANVKQMVQVVGTAEMPRPPMTGGKWGRGKWEQQMREWFGIDFEDIDFLLTFYAPYAAEVSDLEFCAVVKHELCHCSQELDECEAPKFRKTNGLPVFAMKDHDFAGFLDVVRDFGATSERNVTEIVKLVNAGPRIASIDIRRACGTCMLKAV